MNRDVCSHFVPRDLCNKCAKAKSNAERQEALRKRKKEQGLKEIRNIYATPEHEKLIKEYAKTLQEKGND